MMATRIRALAAGFAAATVLFAGTAFLIAARGTAAAEQAAPATASSLAFAGQRGVGGIKTFAFPIEKDDAFVADPYRPSWTDEMMTGRLQELRHAGFDFIRLNVNPGPLLAAEAPTLQRLVEQVEEAVESTLASGMNVLLDIHPSDGHPLWGAHAITADPSGADFQRYLAVVRRLAGVVDQFDPKRVALEVFNEPPSPCSWTDRPDWPRQLSVIYGEARAAASRHTLVISGACYANIDGLMALDGKAFDANTMFTFHYYEPHLFTHQGYWGSDAYLEYVAPLPYPATPATRDAVFKRVRAAIIAAPDLTQSQRDSAWKAARRQLYKYYWSGTDADTVKARFDEARAWGDRHGIAPRRILLGEFGVMKDIYGKTGASPRDRLHWLSDVRRAAESSGFAWSTWALTNTMGIVAGDEGGPLDHGVLNALGLTELEASALP